MLRLIFLFLFTFCFKISFAQSIEMPKVKAETKVVKEKTVLREKEFALINEKSNKNRFNSFAFFKVKRTNSDIDLLNSPVYSELKIDEYDAKDNSYTSDINLSYLKHFPSDSAFDYKKYNLENKGYKYIPTSVSLREFIPFVGEQGKDFSCSAWSVAYALSILKNEEDGISFNPLLMNGSQKINWKDHFYSPYFLFNHALQKYNINDGKRGIDLNQVITIPKDFGLATINECDYQLCTEPISPQVDQVAKKRRQLNQRVETVTEDVSAFQYYLSFGYPIVFSLKIEQDHFINDFYNFDKKWNPNKLPKIDDFSNKGILKNQLNFHSMTCIGFDEDKQAFEVLCSYGPGWGYNGVIWIDYDFLFNNPRGDLIKEAYVIDSDIERLNLISDDYVHCLENESYNLKNMIPTELEQGKSINKGVAGINVQCEKIDFNNQYVVLEIKDDRGIHIKRLRFEITMAGKKTIRRVEHKNATYLIGISDIIKTEKTKTNILQMVSGVNIIVPIAKIFIKRV